MSLTSKPIIEFCLDAARDHEREARQFRNIAAKIRNPPKGTRVEVSGRTVRFITEVASRGSRRPT